MVLSNGLFVFFGFIAFIASTVNAHAVGVVYDVEPDRSPYIRCQECMPRECGRSRTYSGSRVPRVYGGKPVAPGSHPWIAMLVDMDNPTNPLVGSGVLISCNLVLTTAYNMEKVRDFASLRIRLGAVHMNEVTAGEMQFSARRVVIHPEWNLAKSLFANDLALIKLDGNVDFAATDGFIEPICLPSKYQDYSGWLTVAGFGQNLQGTSRGELREAEFFKLTRSECETFVGAPFSFCGLGNDQGLCNGDRGSPAVQFGPDGRFSLTAIANDFQCWAKGSDVYTEISPFVDWICAAPV